MNNNIKKPNDDYEKIKKKIEEANKNIRYYCIQGPKGAKGDKGDKGEKGDKGDTTQLTFKVGNTLTIEPELSADVENVGTDTNVILDFKIPRGFDGKDGEKGEQGEPGVCETITIDGTNTIEPAEEAEVIDNFNNNIHHLTFYIPKGEQGEQGPAGSGAGATALNAVLFTGYQDAKDSRSLTIREKIFIPESTTIFTVPTTVRIDINTTGIYEIMLCGKISGVTEENGAKFFLLNTTTGTVINNLTFELKEGTTSDMTFSGTTITQIFAPASFEVKTSISSDPTTAKITFSDINLIIKRYNM